MWTIIKFKKDSVALLKKDLENKIGSDFIIYRPKTLIQKYKKNKLINLEYEILGDYLFCYHKNFAKEGILNQLKFSKGVKYFLNGFVEYQKDIKTFIEKCKKIENRNGFITGNLFETTLNGTYKFSTGPFTDKIFKIIEFQQSKINILMGNLKTTIKKRDYIFKPI